MREAVLEMLAELVGSTVSAEAAYLAGGKGKQTTSSRPRLKPDPGLTAIVQFLKNVGTRIGDKELVDQCVNAEVQLCSVEALADVVRELCIHHFFHEPKFRVDMSKYRVLVDEYTRGLEDREEIRKLNGYLDEDRKLKEVYEAVKRRLCTPLYSAWLAPEIRRPTFDDVKAAVDHEIAEVYRRADKHFAARLSNVDEKVEEP
jgi:hypothetical protein